MSKGWCKRNESGAHGKHTDGAAPRWALSCRAAPRGPRGAPQPQTPVLPGLPDHLLSQRLQMASRQLPSPSLCGLPAEILLSIVDQLQEKADRQARVPCALQCLCRCLVLYSPQNCQWHCPRQLQDEEAVDRVRLLPCRVCVAATCRTLRAASVHFFRNGVVFEVETDKPPAEEHLTWLYRVQGEIASNLHEPVGARSCRSQFPLSTDKAPSPRNCSPSGPAAGGRCEPH